MQQASFSVFIVPSINNSGTGRLMPPLFPLNHIWQRLCVFNATCITYIAVETMLVMKVKDVQYVPEALIIRRRGLSPPQRWFIG